MFLNHLLLIFTSFLSGAAIAAGTFAFFWVIGVVPRMLRTSGLRHKIMFFENVIMLGIMAGTILTFWKEIPLPQLLSRFLLLCYGASAGIFEGCIAVALAEILDTFPILFRRLKLMDGVKWVMIAMAFGKLAGSLFFFWYGYGMI